MDYTADWSFQGLAGRGEILRRCPRYCDLINQIVDRIDDTQIRFELDPGRYLPVENALRPIFFVEVAEDLGDFFFNGVSGYRAQYYSSPRNGLDANRYAIAQLERKLLIAASKAEFQTSDPNHSRCKLAMPERLVLESLRLPSAKIWGDESDGELQKVTREEQDAVPQIVAPRWLHSAEAGFKKAKKGIKAPRVRTLKFHGAFLRDGKESVPLGKMSRSEDVYFWGFS